MDLFLRLFRNDLELAQETQHINCMVDKQNRVLISDWTYTSCGLCGVDKIKESHYPKPHNADL